MSEKVAAYTPLYKETLQALLDLDATDVKEYLKALNAYAYEGAEPECTGPAMAMFRMSRFQIDGGSR